MKIAVITARGGSKRVPRKNVKFFCGKPMIAWSIETARTSGLFDHVIVSTDDSEIADIARQFGADVPFIRPPDLATDTAGTTEVMAHATRWAQGNFATLEAVCCIYATAPFLQAVDLLRGWEAMRTGHWHFTFSVTEYASSIFRSLKLGSDFAVEMLFPEHFLTRSQELPETFHDCGQFYWGRPQAWVGMARIFDHHSKAIIIPRWRVQDIDTLEDWHQAELMKEVMLLRQKTSAA